jgi:RNA polymerase sigma-70 factor (ECF subfamily)
MIRRGEKLGPDELRAAELGFRQMLRRKRFPTAFIDQHVSDLLAQARLEYARHIASGDAVRSPAGWIIHCAWRRTQNLLEHESRVPRAVSIEEDEELEGTTPTPEEETLQSDRQRRVREAVGELPPEERKLIALTYFEGMSVREASKALGWDNCKGDRRHHSALAQLQELLGVKDAESLQIEIGVAAWALVATESLNGPHLPGPIHGALEGASRGAIELVGRMQELARRLLSGGPAEGGVGAAGARSVEVGGGSVLAAATAGVCGAAAVTCLATGVFVPGLAGTDPGDRQKPEHAPQREAFVLPLGNSELGGIGGEGVFSPALSAEVRRRERGPDRAKRREPEPQGNARPTVEKSAPPPVATPQEVAHEFDPFPEESAPSGSEPAPQQTPSESGRSDPAPEASGKQVEAEFGL